MGRSSYTESFFEQLIQKDPLIVITGEYRTSYSNTTNTLYWNPNETLVASDANGQATGVQSPALRLFHEIAHAVNPNNQEELYVLLTNGLGNLAEQHATESENVVATALGEVTRDNRISLGRPEVVNPTEHTEENSDGTNKWKQVNKDGQTETGPAYNKGDIPSNAPVIPPQPKPGEVTPDPGEETPLLIIVHSDVVPVFGTASNTISTTQSANHSTTDTVTQEVIQIIGTATNLLHHS